jgi:hypothetical protein
MSLPSKPALDEMDGCKNPMGIVRHHEKSAPDKADALLNRTG